MDLGPKRALQVVPAESDKGDEEIQHDVGTDRHLGFQIGLVVPGVAAVHGHGICAQLCAESECVHSTNEKLEGGLAQVEGGIIAEDAICCELHDLGEGYHGERCEVGLGEDNLEKTSGVVWLV